MVPKNGDKKHWVTAVQEMDESKRENLAKEVMENLGISQGDKAVLWCGKMPGMKGRVTKSTYNVLIKSFPHTGITKNQKWNILV